MSSPSNNGTIQTPVDEKWDSEDEFEARLKRIQATAGKTADTPQEGEPAPDLAGLQADNAKLKTSLDEARRRVVQVESELDKFRKREVEHEQLLEEKSEVVRKLEQELSVFKSKQTLGVTEEELLALHAELERERQNLEEDRATMEQQFRQLEMNMSRERAEIARERNELQRTKTELKHKLDALEKGGSHSGYSPLRQLRDEIASGPMPTTTSPTPRPPPPVLPALQNLPALNRKAPEPEDAKRSGILSRFLGKRD